MTKLTDYYMRVYGSAAEKPEVGKPLDVIAEKITYRGAVPMSVDDPVKMTQVLDLDVPEKGEDVVFKIFKVEQIIPVDGKDLVIVVGENETPHGNNVVAVL